MTFFEFLDRQLSRLTASVVAGGGIFVMTAVVLWMLYRDRTLADNDLFKTLSQALVVQGLVGLAMASWFTKKPGDEAQDVRVTNTPSQPVPTTDTPDDPDARKE